ncbi:hypothetical protein HU200_025802 [Digitaria exilis]|uniref:Uncharacterized protein n=1 Tax=Digitaria exilis TaxID=1010633 RepID=A0A835EV19_9POAL|nr:hypothetical protein HU200_025802 [Digitaria exilis]
MPACVSSAQRCVMNCPPRARFSAWTSALSDGERKRTSSAQNSARSFQRRALSTATRRLPSLAPSCRIFDSGASGRRSESEP